MILVAVAKLLPDDAQRAALLATMERCNEACNWLAGEAFAAQTAAKYPLLSQHRLALLALSRGLDAMDGDPRWFEKVAKGK